MGQNNFFKILGLIGTVIVFIMLKLVGVIAWSWWGILFPLWIGLGLVFLSLLFGVANRNMKKKKFKKILTKSLNNIP